jgi:dolichol-phosphate mannosyltransferase
VANPFSIVTPTYKEHDNISPLIERLGRALAGRDYEIVLVDDNSSDGTEDLVAELAERYPVRIIVRRDKKGLAGAVLDGFVYALHDIILVMDADLQHPPEVVPDMVRAMDEGADVAVASRYVSGGGNAGWSKLRQVISNGAIFLAHLLLPLSRKVKDPMSGFFAFRRELIQNTKLEPIGYKILLELIVVTRPRKITEVPFIFQTREKGKSKLNLGQEVDYLKHLWSLMRRSGELTRFLKFAVVGGSGVIVNEGTRFLLTRYGGLAAPRDWIAENIGIELSILTNFLLNNYFTFSDLRTPGARGFFTRLIKFNLVSLFGAGIQNGVYLGLTRYAGMAASPFDILANLTGIALGMLWNFFSNNWWTWKR